MSCICLVFGPCLWYHGLARKGGFSDGGCRDNGRIGEDSSQRVLAIARVADVLLD
jgi:hypothetical protein